MSRSVADCAGSSRGSPSSRQRARTDWTVCHLTVVISSPSPYAWTAFATNQGASSAPATQPPLGQPTLGVQRQAPGEKLDQRISAGCRRQCRRPLLAERRVLGSYRRLQHMLHGFGEPQAISPGNEQAVCAIVGHESWSAAQRVGRYHRASCAHRLCQHLGEALFIGRKYESPGPGRELERVIAPTPGLGISTKIEQPDLLHREGSSWTLADDEQPGLLALPQIGERPDE